MVSYDKFNIDSLQYDTVTSQKKTYINIECGFDIETSSYILADGSKVAYMYEWTFGIKDSNYICYGRTWEQFLELCEKLQQHFNLSENVNLIVYIHNMSFEFQFMRKYFEWLNVFSVDERKPIKALTTFGIEFRDSYILSGYSLQKTAENLQSHKIEKLVGELDYSLNRTYKTRLSKQELAYCENDVLIILYYINEQINQYGDITKVPLTNTGRVRKYVRQNCFYEPIKGKETSKSKKNKSNRKLLKYRNLMNELTITKEEYILLKDAFQGGFTHANARYQGQLLKDVSSIDFTSSYPSVMLSEMFPMSKGIKVNLNEMYYDNGEKMHPKEAFNTLLNNYCVLFTVSFKNLTAKVYQDNYISESKCRNLKNVVANNGRVFSAETLTMTITDIDFRIIQQCYTWDNMGVKDVYKYYKGYLPKDIILSILKLYSDKTTLKGVEDMEVEYLNSKGMLNSVYGMCVTDIVRDEVTYTDNWGKQDADIDKQIEDYNNAFNRFLYYPWGVWVTAYARRNLWLGIINIGDDYIYSDTDSIKMLNYEEHKDFIQAYDKRLITKLEKMCEHYNIDKSLLAPKTIKGVAKMIGVWDYEGTYKRFKTLGAKRYMYQEQDNSYHITVAGLSKKNGVNYMVEKCKGNATKIFNMFNDELYIPPEHTGKMTHTYIDDENEFNCKDYQGNETHIITKSGIHLENCDYTLSISKQYGTFLKMFKQGYLYKGVRENG